MDDFAQVPGIVSDVKSKIKMLRKSLRFSGQLVSSSSISASDTKKKKKQSESGDVGLEALVSAREGVTQRWGVGGPTATSSLHYPGGRVEGRRRRSSRHPVILGT